MAASNLFLLITKLSIAWPSSSNIACITEYKVKNLTTHKEVLRKKKVLARVAKSGYKPKHFNRSIDKQ